MREGWWWFGYVISNLIIVMSVSRFTKDRWETYKGWTGWKGNTLTSFEQFLGARDESCLPANTTWLAERFTSHPAWFIITMGCGIPWTFRTCAYLQKLIINNVHMLTFTGVSPENLRCSDPKKSRSPRCLPRRLHWWPCGNWMACLSGWCKGWKTLGMHKVTKCFS